jgi:hypothetical protein
MRKQLGNLSGACQIAEPEQATSRIQQAEADKLVDGAAGELAQRSNLIGRVRSMQTVGYRLPDQLEKAALAYYCNAIAARSAQFVRRPTVIQEWPTEFAHNE